MRVENPMAAPCDVQEFGPGDHVWVMPDGAKMVQVTLIGGGGGGTSGWRGTPDGVEVDAGTGGNPGTGAGWAVMAFPATHLNASVTVTVGVGGAGDVGATTDGGSGTGGTDGEPTSFGDFLTVAGGRHTALGELVAAPRSMFAPGAGLDGDAAGCPGGGFGGSLVYDAATSTVSTADAAPGGRLVLIVGTAASAGLVDGGPLSNGGDGGDQTTGHPMPGTAGGGGAASLTGPAGSGGKGGDYGAGGGGGGASPDGFPSGDGGSGGDGICTVVTYF